MRTHFWTVALAMATGVLVACAGGAGPANEVRVTTAPPPGAPPEPVPDDNGTTGAAEPDDTGPAPQTTDPVPPDGDSGPGMPGSTGGFDPPPPPPMPDMGGGGGDGGGGPGEFGDDCNDNSDCQSQICVEDVFGAFCTVQCNNAGDCPLFWDCVETNVAGLSVCY